MPAQHHESVVAEAMRDRLFAPSGPQVFGLQRGQK